MHKSIVHTSVLLVALVGASLSTSALLTGCGGGALVAALAAPTVIKTITGGGGGGSTPSANRSVSDYKGTWTGLFTPAQGKSAPAGGQTGTLTLTFSDQGAITGQIADTTTNQIGTVTGSLTVTDGKTQGLAPNLQLTIGSVTQANGSALTINSNNHLVGALILPATTTEIAGGAATSLVSYDLTKQ